MSFLRALAVPFVVRMKSLAALSLVLAYLFLCTNPVAADPPTPPPTYTTTPLTTPFAIVYVRIPRTVGGVTKADPYSPAVPIDGQFDNFPETSRWVSGMSGPGQLVYRDRAGRETVLFDCINQLHTPIVGGVRDPGGPRECLPLDPSVSFDGKKVLFSVLYASFQPKTSGGATITKVAKDPVGAQIFEADLTTFAVRALDYRQLGDFDTSPVHIPWDVTNPNDTDRILFTSNRARELPSSLLYGPNPGASFNATLLQTHIADQDLKNARRVGVHERDGVLHPFVMSDGRVVFSFWSLSHMAGYRHNNGVSRVGASKENEAWLASFDSKGGTFAAVFGRHGRSEFVNGHAAGSVGLHFLTETSDRSWICTDDYYRGTNKGGGVTLCFQKQAVGVEGPYAGIGALSAFEPQVMIRAFTFGANRDSTSVNGGTRDPMGLPGNQLMVTWLRGNACMRPDVAARAFPGNSCDAGIYMTSTVPAGPTEMIKIVDDPNYHEFMARIAEPYQFVYGVPQPAFSGHEASTDGSCYLGSSSMVAEVEPNSAYSFDARGKSSRDCAVQGCKARAIPMSSVKAIRFWQVLPHDSNFLHSAPQSANSGQPNVLKVMTGNRLKLLGDAPLKSDGSFVAQIPCETPYVMAGVTDDGEVVLRDQVPQSLRQGEVRTCTGCHLHSGSPGPLFATSLAGAELNKKFSGIASSVSLIGAPGGFKEYWHGVLQPQVTVNGSAVVSAAVGGQIYEYNTHIVPILNKRCVSCHGAGSSLDLRELGTPATHFAAINNSYEQTAYLPTELWNKIAAEKPPLPGDWEVPHLSKYIHMGFALESLFYWKAKGFRTDGRLDGDVPDDVDYGPVVGSDPHAGLADDYVRIIKNWIDSGAYLHQGNLPSDYIPGP
jgi:hypothetical protein